MAEITISKGDYSVTVYATEIDEEYSNKIFNIIPPQSKSSQGSGPKDVKLVDLLRITHQIAIKRAYITASDTKTAKEVKDDLKSIFNGGDENGGEVTLTYDGDSFTGYIEKLGITEDANDEPDNYTGKDNAKYHIQITFIEGVSI